MNNPDTFISVIIPIYNEEENIDELCVSLTKVLEDYKKEYEIIFVDDGSSDQSIGLLKKYQDTNNKIKIIKLTKNYGQHIALVAGIEHMKGNIIVTMDGDLQNSPKDIPKFINKIEEGYDFVSGWRVNRYDPVLRKIPSYVLNKIICKITGVNLHDYNCGMNAVRKSIIENMDRYGEMRKFFPALMAKLANSCCEVQVEHNARAKGKSKYDFLKLVGLVADFITSFTVKPFRVLGVTGSFLVSLSTFFGIIFIIARLFGLTGPIPQVLFILLISFLSGIQFLILGFMGEYLIRIYQLLQRETLFQVETIIEK